MAIVDFSATRKSTFHSATTLRFYDVQVKIQGWPYYFTTASSERFEAANTASYLGYSDSNGTPWADSADGTGSSQSPNYANYTYLKAKAKYYAELDDGSFYSEAYPTLTSVTLYP